MTSNLKSQIVNLQSLIASPNALAHHYSKFRVAERLLLTGHSHQAWPDVGFDGQVEAWEDAARYVDDKWERAFAKADRVRRGYVALLDDPGADIALAENVHELFVRLLSALPLRERPRIVTTDAEFHSTRRQLSRLAEEGIEIVRVSHTPAAEVASRLAAAVDDRTALVVVSAVFFINAHIVPGLDAVAQACERVGARLLVDAYHATNVAPFSVRRQGLEDAFVTGGGYKYCQLGEGNAFLRLPPHTRLRPAITGWFAEFGELTHEPTVDGVSYPKGGDRFASGTYDPTANYRAARVFDFFAEHRLTPTLLREVSQHQVGLLAREFDALDADPSIIARDRSVPLERLGGFLALRAPRAGELWGKLREQGVFTDYRGDVLRLGPAPYQSDDQLRQAMAGLRSIVCSGK